MSDNKIELVGVSFDQTTKLVIVSFAVPNLTYDGNTLLATVAIPSQELDGDDSSQKAANAIRAATRTLSQKVNL